MKTIFNSKEYKLFIEYSEPNFDSTFSDISDKYGMKVEKTNAKGYVLTLNKDFADYFEMHDYVNSVIRSLKRTSTGKNIVNVSLYNARELELVHGR